MFLTLDKIFVVLEAVVSSCVTKIVALPLILLTRNLARARRARELIMQK